MSVLINGMKMPPNCFLCPLSVLNGERLFCEVTKDEVLRSKIPSDCPIVELPPHGRLIDADELVNGADAFAKRIMQYGGTLVYSQSAIDDAPTIIPAEEVSE